MMNEKTAEGPSVPESAPKSDPCQKEILSPDAVPKRGLAGTSPESREIFANWLTLLNRIGVPYIVGGAFAVHFYTGIWRSTKDLDVFLPPQHVRKVLKAAEQSGFETAVKSGHWLAKVCQGPYFLDLLFGFWNGQLQVSEEWLAASQHGEVAGVPVPLIGFEDLITSKLYVAARDRFDGADILHLIRSRQGAIEWPRILDWLGKNCQLLLWHLLLFDYVYPDRPRPEIRDVTSMLFQKVRENWSRPTPAGFFRGPFLDPVSYNVDLEIWGYEDPRRIAPLLDEAGKML